MRAGAFDGGWEPSACFTACRSAFESVAISSGSLNVPFLAGSLFMLEVYDRILPSHIGLTLLAAG
jgi:ATP-binding cassette subfamily C protein